VICPGKSGVGMLESLAERTLRCPEVMHRRFVVR
jgi:hypothetical protein